MVFGELEKLTDDALFEAYNHFPGAKSLVDGIQKKWNVHHSQKGQPGYDEKNVPAAAAESKKAVKELLGKQKSGLEAKAASPSPYSGQMKNAAGLIVTAGLVALAATTGVYIPPIY